MHLLLAASAALSLLPNAAKTDECDVVAPGSRWVTDACFAWVPLRDQRKEWNAEALGDALRAAVAEAAKSPGFSHYSRAPPVVNGNHRSMVGGASMWETIGLLQLRFMVDAGLTSSHTLLDLGAGSLRGGHHFIAYLDAARYYAIDINRHLLEAGYTHELNDMLRAKLPLSHLIYTPNYEAAHWGAGVFDFALSVSLWSHLPLSELRRCLVALTPGMKRSGEGVYFTSFFKCENVNECSQPLQHARGGVISFPDRDPFHHSVESLRRLAEELDDAVRFELVGDWNHPRGQVMASFTWL